MFHVSLPTSQVFTFADDNMARLALEFFDACNNVDMPNYILYYTAL